MNAAIWHLGDELEWTVGRLKHRGVIVAFNEPDGVTARTTERDPIYFGTNARVPWAAMRRPSKQGRKPKSAT